MPISSLNLLRATFVVLVLFVVAAIFSIVHKFNEVSEFKHTPEFATHLQQQETELSARYVNDIRIEVDPDGGVLGRKLYIDGVHEPKCFADSNGPDTDLFISCHGDVLRTPRLTERKSFLLSHPELKETR